MKYVTQVKVGPEDWIKYKTCSQVDSFCQQCQKWVYFQIWVSPKAQGEKNYCEDCLIKILEVKIDKPEDHVLYLTIEDGLIVLNAQLRNPPEIPGQRYFLFGQEVFRSKVDTLYDTATLNQVPPMDPQSLIFYKPKGT